MTQYSIIARDTVLVSVDLQEEARRRGQVVHTETARVEIEGHAEHCEVLFLPLFERAGISWGADALWTDASGIEDAIERYLGIDGKETSN